MKTTEFIFAVLTTVTLFSCGGKDEKADEKELDLCECMELQEKHSSEEEARKELGDETVGKCIDLFNNAKDEDREKCK